MTAALVEASRDALAQLRRRAAEKLQCAADELDYAGGVFRVRRTGGAISLDMKEMTAQIRLLMLAATDAGYRISAIEPG